MSEQARCSGCNEPITLDDDIHRPLRPAGAILHDRPECIVKHLEKINPTSPEVREGS